VPESYLIRLIVSAAVAFLLGSIPTSYLLGKYIYGIDPRDVGSGATGATNTARAMGPAAGIVTALADIAKGWLALFVTQHYLVTEQIFGTAKMQWALGAALIAVIAGHAFSPWLRFRGGKGVAVAGGAMLALLAPLFFIELATLIVITLLSGFVGLGSILVALALPVLLAAFPATRSVPLVISGLVAGLFVVWLHRENIARLRAGTENKLSWNKAENKRDTK